MWIGAIPVYEKEKSLTQSLEKYEYIYLLSMPVRVLFKADIQTIVVIKVEF